MTESDRTSRLGDALRRNLRRRKDQERARVRQEPTPSRDVRDEPGRRDDEDADPGADAGGGDGASGDHGGSGDGGGGGGE